MAFRLERLGSALHVRSRLVQVCGAAAGPEADAAADVELLQVALTRPLLRDAWHNEVLWFMGSKLYRYLLLAALLQVREGGQG